MREFGDAEIASLVLPRRLAVEYSVYPQTQQIKTVSQGIRRVTAPGMLSQPEARELAGEVRRARALVSDLFAENEVVTVYDVKLDVWPDVFAWGYLIIPKNIKSGEQRPVVVCQHGLEGLPTRCTNEDKTSRDYKGYKGIALYLARQGFVTFSPHNPYRGGDDFRMLQRKLNPLGKTLFSVINTQHGRIPEWLGTQPFIDPARIVFYGLSYGGKSAMRIPAVHDGYCLSICSGDLPSLDQKGWPIGQPQRRNAQIKIDESDGRCARPGKLADGTTDHVLPQC